MPANTPSPHTLRPDCAGIPPEVQEQAAMWLVELQAAPDDATLRQQWQEWRAQDVLHEQAWQQVAAMGERLARLPAPLVQATLERAGPAKQSKGPPMQARLERTGLAEQDNSRRHTVKTLVLLMGVGTSAWLLRDEAAWQPVLADARTGVGERRTLTLDDGSTLELNTDTAVRIDFTATARRIRLLQGEILLTSGNDPAHAATGLGARPLSVATRHGSATALGTRFAVRHLPGSGHSQVEVFQGQVRILAAAMQDASHAITLQPGQRTQFDARQIAPVQAVDANALAWRNGILVAVDMPMERFIAQLARYHHGRLECDPSAAHIPVTGTFPTRDTRQVLNLLRATLPIRLETRQRLLGAATTRVFGR